MYNKTSFAMSTPAIWCRVVRSRDSSRPRLSPMDVC